MNKKKISLVMLVGVMVFLYSGCTSVVGDGTPSKSRMEDKGSNIENKDWHKRIRVALLLKDSRIVLNQPVRVKFLVENDSLLPIKLDLGANFKENFLFTITYPDGTRADLPQYSLPPMGGIHLKGNVSVEPQKTYTRTFILNEWANLNKTGTYTIEGRLKAPIESVDGFSEASNFKVDFRIGREDEEYIKELCEDYLNRLENANYSEADEIGNELSYFDSPAAVPYVIKALGSSHLRPENMINSLRERGTTVAVESLIGFVREQPESASTNYAKSALEFVWSTTKDNELKKRIRQGLAI